MQLNESTYETIFLLYIDKELSPKESLEVEAFIADNPSYALEMEALQATVISSEKLQYPFKENLKHQDWEPTYSTIIKEDLQAIPRLSTSFKNALKKEVATEGIIVKPFGFSQQKFTYAAIAACLMVFLGYQQLTKAPVSNSIAANKTTLVVPNTNSTKPSDEIGLSNASPEKFAKVNVLDPKINQVQKLNVQAVNTKNIQGIHLLQKESIAMAETAPANISINQTVITKLPSNYNNPISVNAIPLTITSIDIETAIEEDGQISYEVIDTEDPNRTIFIANFEIDGNKLRGLKRKVISLFKNNKSDRK